MTQEEKQLLLVDLCGRLPYGVKIYINSCVEGQNQMQLFDVNLEGETIGVGNEKWAFRAIPIIDDEDETKVIKPYLRPMSSMTEEEKDEFDKLMNLVEERCINAYGKGGYTLSFTELNDWLNKNKFDYRGLIKKGLALEAKEEMYPSH